MGDKDRRSGKHQQQPKGDPRTWKFDAKTQELLDACTKFIPRVQEPIPADDEVYFCICHGSDDGRAMIECSNGKACLMNWFHLECICMANNEVPDEEEPWFCEGCQDNSIGKLRKNAPKSTLQSVVKKPNADRMKHYESIEATLEEIRKSKQNPPKKLKEKNKNSPAIRTTPVLKPLEMSTSSPGTPKPWTAELDKSFVDDPETSSTYNLNTLVSAIRSLRARPVGEEVDDDSGFEIFDESTTTTRKVQKGVVGKKGGSWTKEEQDHLVEVVTEAHKAGLRGEHLWTIVHPKMMARGVDRPVGGMRMVWLRELRQKTMLDERRKANSAKMQTAIQKPRKKPAATTEDSAKDSEVWLLTEPVRPF